MLIKWTVLLCLLTLLGVHEAAVGTNCTTDSDCVTTKETCDNNSTSTCQCARGYYQQGSECNTKLSYDAACSKSPDNCQDANGLSCQNVTDGDKCRCTENKYWDSVTTQCEIKKNVGDVCSADVQCGVENSECSGGECACTSTSYEESETSCKLKKNLNGICTDKVQCGVPNSDCLGGIEKRCACTSSHYPESQTSCQPRKSYDESCIKSPNSCLSSTQLSCMTIGSEDKCRCEDNYYWDKTFLTCKPSQSYDNTCQIAPDSCGTNLTCITMPSVRNKCRCSHNTTYWSFVDSACKPRNDLSVTCSQSDTKPCKDANAECVYNDAGTGTVCRCIENYFDSNGFETSAGICEQMLKLRPTIRTYNVTTTEITMKWTSDPELSSQIDVFEAYWEIYESGLSGEVRDVGTNYSAVISDLTPGQQYNFVVTLKEKGSRQTIQYEKSDMHKDRTYPAMPGDLTSSVYNAPDITITWNASAGVVHTYSIKVTRASDNSVLGKQEIDYPTVTATFPSAAQGTTYNVEIIAKSALSNQRESKTRQAQIRTTSTALQIELSETCSDTKRCNDPNAECISNNAGSGTVCRCKERYFDGNGFETSGGICEPISKLRPTVSTTNVTTNEITVTWTTDATLSRRIDAFEVYWEMDGSGISGKSRDVGKTYTSVISDLIPGQQYVLVVGVTERGSRQTDQLEKSDPYKDRTYPAMPGDLTSSVYDAPDITITWNASTGVVHTYSIKVSRASDNSELGSKVVNSATLTAIFSSAISGTRYNVEIIALSESSNQRQSEARRTVIRTTTTKPNPPTNLVCDPTDKDLTLSWTPPSFPNGDILHYIVTYNTKGNNPTTVKTTDSSPSKTVSNLKPGTDYEFKVQTVNDKFTSDFSQMAVCRTNDETPGEPKGFKSTGKSSNEITMSWELPTAPNGEIFAYRLTVANGTKCLQEILFTCVSGCVSSNSATFLTKHTEFNTPCGIQTKIMKTKADLYQLIAYKVTGLSPFVNYSLTLTAINHGGDGYENKLLIETDETAPSAVSITTAMAMSATTIKVSWEINGPRPGITTYTIQVFDRYGTRNDLVKTETVTGFYERSYVVTGLQEYWSYSFSVTAQTSKGSTSLMQTTIVTTQMAAPGAVDAFVAKKPDGTDLTQVYVSWQIPQLEQRNGLIAIYKLVHNISEDGSYTSITVTAPTQVPGKVEMIFTVTPDMQYYFKITAINSEGTEGQPKTTIYYAPLRSELSSDCSPEYPDTFIAGIAMIAISVLCLVVSLGLTFYNLRRTGAKDERGGSSQKSEEQSHVSLEQGDGAFVELNQPGGSSQKPGTQFDAALKHPDASCEESDKSGPVVYEAHL